MDATPKHSVCPLASRLRGAAMPLMLLMAAVAGCSQQTHWYHDYPQGERAAQAQHRPMLLYFWDWLSRDQARIDLQVFSDPRVTAAMRRTVNVRLEAGWFRDLARQYDIRQTPTFILADARGIEQSRLSGVPAPEEFVAWLDTALQQAAGTQPATPTTQPASPSPADPQAMEQPAPPTD